MRTAPRQAHRAQRGEDAHGTVRAEPNCLVLPFSQCLFLSASSPESEGALDELEEPCRPQGPRLLTLQADVSTHMPWMILRAAALCWAFRCIAACYHRKNGSDLCGVFIRTLRNQRTDGLCIRVHYVGFQRESFEFKYTLTKESMIATATAAARNGAQQKQNSALPRIRHAWDLREANLRYRILPFQPPKD